MAPYLEPIHRTTAERRAHVLRASGDCHAVAADWLAAEERHLAWAADAARHRFQREAGLPSSRTTALVASLRRLTGTALIRAGERLRGRPDLGPSPRVALGA